MTLSHASNLRHASSEAAARPHVLSARARLKDRVPPLGGRGCARADEVGVEKGEVTPAALVAIAAGALAGIVHMNPRGAPPGAGASDMAQLLMLRLMHHIQPWCSPDFAGPWQAAVAACVASVPLAIRSARARHRWDGEARPETTGGGGGGGDEETREEDREGWEAALTLAIWRNARALVLASDRTVSQHGVRALGRVCTRSSGLWRHGCGGGGGLGEAIWRWAISRHVRIAEAKIDGQASLNALQALAALAPLKPAMLRSCAAQAPPFFRSDLYEGGGWVGEEERVERALEQEEARRCEVALRLGEESAEVQRHHMSWARRVLDVCVEYMDPTMLFHSQAAFTLAATMLAAVPALPLDGDDGGTSGGRRRARGAHWAVACVDRLCVAWRALPPESSATADSPVCRMLRAFRRFAWLLFAACPAHARLECLSRLGDRLALVPQLVPIGVAMARELAAAAAASLSPEDSWKCLSLLVSPVVQCLVGRPDWWVPLGLSSTDRSGLSVCGCCCLLAMHAQMVCVCEHECARPLLHRSDESTEGAGVQTMAEALTAEWGGAEEEAAARAAAKRRAGGRQDEDPEEEAELLLRSRLGEGGGRGDCCVLLSVLGSVLGAPPPPLAVEWRDVVVAVVEQAVWSHDAGLRQAGQGLLSSWLAGLLRMTARLTVQASAAAPPAATAWVLPTEKSVRVVREVCDHFLARALAVLQGCSVDDCTRTLDVGQAQVVVPALLRAVIVCM